VNLKKQILIVVTLCCCAVVATEALKYAWADKNEVARAQVDRKVTTSGTVTMSVMPDTIYWNISLRDRNAKASAVKTESDEKLKRVLALQRELGIGKDDIQVCHMKFRRGEESHDRGRTKTVYYEITRNVTVRQTDLSRFGELFSAFVGIGGVDVSYKTANAKSEDIRKVVRQRALQVASQKAQAAAKELDVRLGAVRTIQDQRPVPAQASYGGGSYRAQAADLKTGVVAPSAIDITASVDVVFDLH